ncbi:dephospho-CoA kinase (plasmid) [Legionella adelaidensis]|uniref:Dephospho-CoA kinase n=1 Tax=Legionella adelaidensis TaxID=45056 RepID=A0A0W0R3Q3_9GAMM|nr:dephospho-CoA kinase [Legionella adelaidensis]KTC65660.1 dephospho-CoA kinase [Legionella adelaidensis]VEH85144.1 dephospho-CoA kinase [Legionella adelaidensis]
MVFCIGLTGTIASGKSTVAQEFANLGVPIISADGIAKEITAKNTPISLQIIHHFGSDVASVDGALNRSLLRKIIFNNPQEKLWLENLLHPLIRKEIAQQIKTINAPYCIIEIPLLKNKKNYPYLNRILVVLAGEETQIKRLMKRDHCSKQEGLAILKTQASETALKAIADDIVINNGGLQDLQKKIQHLHANYLRAAQIIRGN